MLEGFSSQSGQRDKTQSEGGFSFQLGSVSGGWDWLMEPFKIAESIYVRLLCLNAFRQSDSGFRIGFIHA